MSRAAAWWPARLIRRVSAETLFLGVMCVSILCAVLFTALILRSVQRDTEAMLDRLGAGLAARLEQGGLGALILATEQLDAALLPGGERVEVAIWRWRGGAWQPLRESPAGAATLLAALPEGGRALLTGEDTRFAARALDLGALSHDWDTPVADIRLAYAIGLPTEAMHAARWTLGAIWAGYCLALCIGLLLRFNHRARYRAGLRHISEVLAAFSEGATSARVDDGLPAPELVRVGAQINEVLPRIEQLMAGLRYASAHLAHEIRTPLQALRSEVARLARAEKAEERRVIETSIDKTIDHADARLQSVMRLFRLQAGGRVEAREGVDLGEIVEEQILDLGDMLEAGGRSLAVTLAEGVRVRCDAGLMETLLINLLSNAAKYSPPGAQIVVTLARDCAGFRLSVGNSGSAFPEALGGQAFSRFARGERHGTMPGFGLGLSTVAAIAAQHGFVAEIVPPRAGIDADAEPWAEVVVTGPLVSGAEEVPA